MKTVCTRMKGVCLLLLGLATTTGGRSLAGDIDAPTFGRLAGNSSAAAAGTAEANPFRDESASTPAMAGPVQPTGIAASPSHDAGIASASDDFVGAPGQIWFRGEYLHWWTSGAHLPPMVSTLTNGFTVPVTLFGDQTVYNGNHDGYLINLGMWLDREHCWGVEMDYVDVSGRQSNYDSGFTDGYDAHGNPYPIVRLAYDPATYGTTGIAADYIGLPGLTPGSEGYVVGRLTVDTSDYFQSAGLTLRRQLQSCEWSSDNRAVNWTDPSARTFRLDAIGGYRFARLIDTVNEQDNSFVYNPNQDNYLWAYNYVNDYRTVNEFNGGELGLNAVYTVGRWSLDVVSKVALGINNEYASLYNQQTIDKSNAGGPGPTPQNPSPLQEFSRNRFSAMPKVTVTAGYQVTDHLKVTAGYDLLYWTAVARAANQIAVEPTTGYPYGTVLDNYSALPAFSWNETHYFAQGMRLGAELRF